MFLWMMLQEKNEKENNINIVYLRPLKRIKLNSPLVITVDFED